MGYSCSTPSGGEQVSLARSDPRVHGLPTTTHAPGSTHGRHVVQLYTDDGFLIDVLSRFIGGALAVGDVAVVVATASHRNELEKRLSGRVMDISKAAAQGRYVTVDANDALGRFMVNGVVDESRF